MYLKDLSLLIPNFISKDECEFYIDCFEKRKVNSYKEDSSYAGDGSMKLSNYKVVEVKESSDIYENIAKKQELALQNYVEYLETFSSFHISNYKKVLRFPHKIRILRYGPNEYIHPHMDWDHFIHASIVFNLNSDYEGGEFAFFNGKHKINLRQGDALIFPADHFWVHEVLPVTKGYRYSINSFICSLPQNLRLDTLKYAQELFSSSDRKPVFNLK